MMAVCSADTSVTNYQAAHHCATEHWHQCGDIKLYKVWIVISCLAHCNQQQLCASVRCFILHIQHAVCRMLMYYESFKKADSDLTLSTPTNL